MSSADDGPTRTGQFTLIPGPSPRGEGDLFFVRVYPGFRADVAVPWATYRSLLRSFEFASVLKLTPLTALTSLGFQNFHYFFFPAPVFFLFVVQLDSGAAVDVQCAGLRQLLIFRRAQILPGR
jgi:hypothetical protein